MLDLKTEPGIYGIKEWTDDGEFSAAPGQQVTEEVYDAMLNGVPPKIFSEEAMEKASELGLCIFAGFLMGEPDSGDEHGSKYLAFGMSNDRYYYVGKVHANRKGGSR